MLSVGCTDDVPEVTTSGDNDSSTSGTTDGSTTLPPTGDPTNPTTDPTSSSSSGVPTTGSSSGGDSSSSGDSSSGGGSSSSGDSSSSGGEASSSSGGACGFLDCDGGCIDPDTNPNFCGATACEGKEAGVVCSGSASCQAGECVESCENCSFESGDFTGWTVVDLTEPFIPAGVGADGFDPEQLGFFGAVTATDGTSVAFNGFDGNGASDTGEIAFGQNLDIREGATTLEFDYRVAWDLLNEATALVDRTFEVHIEPAGGGKPIETALVETAAFGTVGDVGNSGSVDVSAYGGQTVFVNFVWTVPEDFSGPARAELDNVRVLAE